MPKIEIDEKQFYAYAGRSLSGAELVDILVAAKAELDGRDDAKGILKIELNDTNRPDLWSAAGLARQIRSYVGGKKSEYGFFSRPGKAQDAGDRVVQVDAGLQTIRPYIVAFAVQGRKITENDLLDIIQAQEKLCSNYGRKRKSIAMGVYRSDLVRFPVRYQAADPDKTRFVPLQMTEELSLREILAKHPKGQEYGHIVRDFPLYPYLADAKGDCLSFPPIINSARLGAVEVGDEKLFVEMTGTDLHILLLAASITACDLADAGFAILPVKVVYPYDTPFGREIVTPYYFQKPVSVELAASNRQLGVELTVAETDAALKRMGLSTHVQGATITVDPPEYRNDFLHPVDIMEDVMIGRGMASFAPQMPADFTVGRLSAEETFRRRVRDLLLGLGYQEMIYNYLGSRRDFADRMRIDEAGLVRISNPMTENYEYLRNSILPNLLSSEAVSGDAVYPHRIFETGKIVLRDPATNHGSRTVDALGFLTSDTAVDFNTVNSQVAALFYYLDRDFAVKTSADPRFAPGRGAEILSGGRRVGILGEIHPEVLANWGITMPCVACELDLDAVLGA